MLLFYAVQHMRFQNIVVNSTEKATETQDTWNLWIAHSWILSTIRSRNQIKCP